LQKQLVKWVFSEHRVGGTGVFPNAAVAKARSKNRSPQIGGGRLLTRTFDVRMQAPL